MLQATLALVFLFIFLFFWVIRRTYSFWNGKGIPYLSFTDYVKLVYDNFTKPLHEVALKNYRRRGRLYGSYEGFVPTLVVGDPLLLRDIYVKDFKSFSDRIASNATGNPLWDKMMLNSPEEEWKTTRTMMSPAFTTSRLKAPEKRDEGKRAANCVVSLGLIASAIVGGGVLCGEEALRSDAG
ncbi:cytochrome P450 3A41 isoform X1 [Ixodes scapularis]